MIECKCEFCGEPYTPRQYNQRFCSKPLCRIEFYADERRKAVARFRAEQVETAQQEERAS